MKIALQYVILLRRYSAMKQDKFYPY